MRKIRWPLAFAGGAVALVLFQLMTYAPHSESVLAYLAVKGISLVCGVFVPFAGLRRDAKGLAAWVAALTICLLACGVQARIPLCPMCEGITAEELGWLSYWIPIGP